MKKIILSTIRAYQKYISTEKGVFKLLGSPGIVCRFTPSCSEYSYQAISKHGILKGGLMGVKRLLRCHPLSIGGYDPVK